MKKTLIYGLSLALVLSLTACRRPEPEQPAEPREPAPAVSTPAPVDVSTPEPVTAPEPEQTPATPAENEDIQLPEDTTPQEPAQEQTTEPPKETEPAPTTKPVQQQTQQSEDNTQQQTQQDQPSSGTQKIDGHDDLGDYVLNGKGGKYYPALGITLPVSYDGTTTNGAPPQTPEEQEAAKREYENGLKSSDQHTESWQGVTGG